MGIGRFLYTPVLPFMADAISLSPSQSGLIASANFAGYLAGALLAAVPGLPGGRRFWLALALAVSALTTGAMAGFDGVPAHMALRAAGGVASAFALVFASSLVVDHLTERGAAWLSVVHFAGVGFGIVLSALATWALHHAGWQAIWLAGAVLTLAAAVLALALIPPGSRQTGGSGAGPKPGLWRLVAAYGCLGFGYVITATFIVAIIREGSGGIAREAAIWCLVGAAAMPSVWLWNRLVPRLGGIATFRLALVIEAGGVAISVLWDGVVGLILGALALGGTFMALTAMGFALARQRSGGQGRSILGVMTASFGLGQMIGPAIAGWLREATGSYTIPSLLAAAVLIAGAVLVSPLAREERAQA